MISPSPETQKLNAKTCYHNKNQESLKKMKITLLFYDKKKPAKVLAFIDFF